MDLLICVISVSILSVTLLQYYNVIEKTDKVKCKHNIKAYVKLNKKLSRQVKKLNKTKLAKSEHIFSEIRILLHTINRFDCGITTIKYNPTDDKYYIVNDERN